MGGRLRKALAWMHRWASLLAGALLVVLGLSGSLLVWQAELDAALNPGWFRPLPACSAIEPAGLPTTATPVARVLQVLQQQAPGRQPNIVVAPHESGAAWQVWEKRDAHGLRREHFIDMACGQYLGARDRGLVRWDAQHLVPTVYELHRYFWSGETGATVAGTGGLVLLGLGLTGLVLAWPRQALRWAAWRRTLGIQWQAAPARRWYDVHRAVGFWLAPLLVLLSLTGAALVFGDTTRAWVGAVLPLQAQPRLQPRMQQSGATPAPADSSRTAGALSPDELVALASAQFPQAQWSRLTLPTGRGAAEVRLLQPGEPRADTGNTRVRISPGGEVLLRYDPQNAPAGNVLLNWLFPLHSAEAFGLAARVLWSLFGLVPTLLLATGLWLWWRRRRALRLQKPGAAARRHTPGPRGPSPARLPRQRTRAPRPRIPGAPPRCRRHAARAPAWRRRCARGPAGR